MANKPAIDHDAVTRALEVSGERANTADVTTTLPASNARREQRRLVELMGKLEWDDSFDHKAERSRT